MVEVYGLTDVGLIREQNEDAFLINQQVITNNDCYFQLAEENFLVAIADGVGGLNAGEIASQLCLRAMAKAILPITADNLEQHIKSANIEVFQYGQNNPSATGLGTTLAGMICQEEKIMVFNVGDSRVYRFRDGFLRQLTIDDSLVQVLLEAGKISREEMFDSPDKNIILQMIGQNEEKVALDVSIQQVRGSLEPGDIYLLCSDGLSDMMTLVEIEDIINQYQSLTDVVQELVKEAKLRGGYDNITIIAVKKSS